jgi:signal transduction histidine kinase
VGFDVASAREDASSGRLGIISVQQRTALLGGTLEIRSRPGDGTTAHAVLPLVARQLPGPASQLAA